MGKEDRDWYRGKHPAYCTCAKCHPRRISLRNIVPWRPRRTPPTQAEDPAVKKATPEPKPRVEEPVVEESVVEEPVVSRPNPTIEEPVVEKFVKDDSPRSTAAQRKPPLVPGGIIGGVWLMIPRAIRKLLLSCLVIALLGAMVQLGALLFTRQVGPMPEALIFIGEAVALFIAIWVIRGYKYRRVFPHFGTVLLAGTTIIVVLAFAGVEPFSAYKDSAWSWVNEEARPWIEERVSDAKEVVGTWGEQSEFEAIFNDYRQVNGLDGLIFTDDLNTAASHRLEELKSEYSHNSAGGWNQHLAENIAKMEWNWYGIARSPASLSDEGAFTMWKNSPGHNANMLGTYRFTGYAIGEGYAVQLFTRLPTKNGEPLLPPGWYWE